MTTVGMEDVILGRDINFIINPKNDTTNRTNTSVIHKHPVLEGLP